MPWIVPSHQAPVLPLVRWKPQLFSGLALVLGTLVPDLTFILSLDENGFPPGHTFAGQILITMPLVVVLYLLATGLVLPWLLPRLPGGRPFYLDVLARCERPRSARALAKIAFSGMIGGLTHVAIDGFTHADSSGWALPLLPILGASLPQILGALPVYELLQIVLTIGLGIVAFRGWQRMALGARLAQSGPSTAEAAVAPGLRPLPLEARDALVRALAAAAVVGALLAPLVKGAYGTPNAVKLAAYGAITAIVLTVLLGALLERLREAIAFFGPRVLGGRETH